ncbi:MAG: UDP-3-O-[3-hydroxymyristoyl] N-acetylglucosamine deacetylase [Deltaproteobacteria bacterium]|nr:UDP-3-O-[3-hydroxymyristoyl] N-acetylglucosamine deacetylase [Deltaproteobacteria bacterium]
MEETILVIDDEEKIRASLRGVLSDEGFRVLDTDGTPQTLDLVATERPDLVILDIWMPRIDGIELLERMKIQQPELPVIVISGHGTIETAVRATKLGASDFLEKPFSIETLLRSVYRATGRLNSDDEPLPDRVDTAVVTTTLRRSTRQTHARTIDQSVVVQGRGLHSGMRTGVILHPMPPGTGIVFGALSASDVTIPATVDYVDSTGYATSLRREGVIAQTIEHLMSALHAHGITNLLVKMQGEIPILDGSALEFCQLLEEGGIVEQAESIEPVRIDRPYQMGTVASGKFVRIEPADRFEVHYTLRYPEPVGEQVYHYIHRDAHSYQEEIAPARTFGFLKDIQMLEQMGLANGGRLNNCILIGEQGVINPPLRFPDELVRHKILDLLGDLYLLGRPIQGKVTACGTGHTDNVALVRAIREQMGARVTVH